jgi:hypothetical protein
MLALVSLSDELDRIAASAVAFAEPDETLSGVLPAEPARGERVYLCAFEGAADTSWIAFDGEGRPIQSRRLVREAASIAAICELAEEIAGGGDLDELSAQLVALRITENPPGIAEAEEAVRQLQQTLGAPPRVASAGRLDSVGAATRRLEQALGEGGSPFGEAMKGAIEAVERVADDVVAHYKGALE